MQLTTSPVQTRMAIDRIKSRGSVGFVPTMGAFHDGHLALMRRALEENDVVVVSVYVNPTQFGLGEDFKRYPRNLERDSWLAEEEGIDLLFVPSDREMYPDGTPKSWVRVEGLESQMAGHYRPGHFRGVATIVAKLMSIVRPDNVYFGEKDYQQLVIVEQMVRDLNLGAEVVRCPTVRAADGLALSSRNQYLSPEEKKGAIVLYKALTEGKAAIQAGVRDSSAVLREMELCLEREPLCRVQSVGIYDCLTLEKIEGKIRGNLLLSLSVHFGTTRLIDHIVINLG